MTEKKDEVTVKEAAEILGVSKPRIHQLTREGRLTILYVNRNREFLFSKDEVQGLKDHWHRVTGPDEKFSIAVHKFSRSLKSLAESGYRPAVEILEKITS